MYKTTACKKLVLIFLNSTVTTPIKITQKTLCHTLNAPEYCILHLHLFTFCGP